MGHWLDGVAKVLQSSDLSLTKLAELGGVSPHRLYQYKDLSGCNLCGQDLRNIDLTGAALDGAKLDHETIFDARFDPRSKESTFFKFRLNKKLSSILNAEAHFANYTYAVWHVKYLFDLIFRYKAYKGFQEIVDGVLSIGMEDLYISDSRINSNIKTIRVPEFIQNYTTSFPKEVEKISRPSFLLLCIIIMRNKNLTASSGIIPTLDVLNDKLERYSRRPTSTYVSEF